MTAEELIYVLYKYFNVDNNIDLAKEMNVTKQTISNWKTRDSISAIKKKCYELGIYDNIFSNTDFSNSTNTVSNNSSIIDNSTNKSTSTYVSNIPENLIIELNSLFSKIKDETQIKKVSYQIEDYIIDLKRKMRD